MNTAAFLTSVLFASVVHFLLGFLWYSPLLFGPDHKKLMKKAPKKKVSPAVAHTVAFITIFIAVYVLAILLYTSRIAGASNGALIGFVVGLAFMATTLFSEALYTSQPPKLFLINVAYRVVGLTLAGAVLAS
jgi:hypothetical protein